MYMNQLWEPFVPSNQHIQTGILTISEEKKPWNQLTNQSYNQFRQCIISPKQPKESRTKKNSEKREKKRYLSKFAPEFENETH